MAFRLPASITGARPDSTIDVLQHEIMAEKAASLGRAGGAIEIAMRALASHTSDDADARDALVQRAADAVHAFMIQRELLGSGDHRAALEAYGVTREVLARVGVKPRR
jgi:hypothetical protein